MNIMFAGIEVSIVYFDDDLMELEVFGSNGNFSGWAVFYIGHDDLKYLANAFRGFPVSVDDHREFILGNIYPECDGGGVRFRLLMPHPVGCAEVEFRVRTNPGDTNGKSETAEFSISVEPASIDDFVTAVSGMALAVGSTARLRGQLGVNRFRCSCLPWAI